MRKRQGDEDGFTLVEVLVAFAILSLSLTVLFQAFTLSAKGTDRIAERKTAIALAATLFDRVGTDIPLLPGEKEGDFVLEGFRWRISVETSALIPEADRKRRGLFPYDIRGEVLRADSDLVLAEFETVRLGRQ